LEATTSTLELDSGIISTVFAASLPLLHPLRSSTSAGLQLSNVCHRRQGMLCKAANIIRALPLTACSAGTTLNFAAALLSTQSGLQDCDRETRDWAARGGQHNQHSTSTAHHQASMPSFGHPWSTFGSPFQLLRALDLFAAAQVANAAPAPPPGLTLHRQFKQQGQQHPQSLQTPPLSLLRLLLVHPMALAKHRLWIPLPSPLTSTFRQLLRTPQPSSRLPSITNSKKEMQDATGRRSFRRYFLAS
jgi:hypothetical protein